jgi:hypothetical protein
MQARPPRADAMPTVAAREGRAPNRRALPTTPITVTRPGWSAAPCAAGASERPVFIKSTMGAPLIAASRRPLPQPIPAQVRTPRRTKKGSSRSPATPKRRAARSCGVRPSSVASRLKGKFRP